MCAAFRVRYIFSVRGATFLPSSRKLSFVVFYIRHLCITPSKFTVMRVSLSLVALVAGAQALSSSLYQKRGGVDTCANVKCSVDIPNPLTGKTTAFGGIGEIILFSSYPIVVLNAFFFGSFGRHVSMPFRNTRLCQVQFRS